MFDLKRAAYSIRGSYLIWDEAEGGIVLKSAHGGGCRAIYRISLPGAKISFEPWELKAETADGTFAASLFRTDGTFLRGNMPVVLEYCEPENVYNANFVLHEQGGLRIGDIVNNGFTHITPLKGTVRAEAPSNARTPQRKYLHKCLFIRVEMVPDESGEFIVALEQFRGGQFAPIARDLCYERNIENVKRDYRQWTEPLCKGDAKREESAYVLWSNLVPPGGLLPSETMLMSKAGMPRVWSWDNGFNALALAETHFELALEQFLLPYRHISEAGRVFDSVCEDHIEWTHVKPPVQGWIYRRMTEKNPAFGAADVLERVYFYVKRNTDWWLNFQGEIPAYFHGNDSGCDNATCFDESEHIETPELQALLSEQCAFLSETAQKLGLNHDARHYSELSEHFARIAAERYFDGKIFVLDAETGEKRYTGALMPMRALILGKRLPEKLLDYLIGRVREHHAGKFGIASEALDSPLYMKDGYWRGPAWAPDQILFVYALRENGQGELADRIAHGYIYALDEYGLGENSDAETGEPLRCKNYCWTACARLLL